MTNKTFRIALFEGATTTAKDLAVLAAMSNGNVKPLTIGDLKSVYDEEVLKYPILNSEQTFEVIGETLIHLDKKIGKEYKIILSIQEVELYSLDNNFED